MKAIVIELPTDGKQCFRAVIKPGDPVTICEIQSQYQPVVKGFWKVYSYGLGVCKSEDTYDYETGLRMALRSALRKIGDLNLRTAAWEAYLERFPIECRKKTATTTPGVIVWSLDFSSFGESCEHFLQKDLRKANLLRRIQAL